MSILNKKIEEEISMAKVTANMLKNETIQNYNYLLMVYENGVKNFWHNPLTTPQEIAAELGSDAAEVFNIHSKLGDFLYQFNPEKVSEVRSLVGRFTINSNGTITIN